MDSSNTRWKYLRMFRIHMNMDDMLLINYQGKIHLDMRLRIEFPLRKTHPDIDDSYSRG